MEKRKAQEKRASELLKAQQREEREAHKQAVAAAKTQIKFMRQKQRVLRHRRESSVRSRAPG